ncbi:hypothetical protein CK203_109312 [Vitis vinifera]|uniref:Myb-like domain-containing protein n=1 Tax=Vitis vinifera TaxID=29760 RepID=A0A438C4Q7_VITVI|nr:hypothetical protein CK203_109312 [Vitis vinifera]
MKTTNKEDVVCNDFGFDIIQNEAVNVKDYVEVGSKKHRRVGGEATEVKEFSDVKFHDGREKKGSLQLNEEQDVRDNCDLKLWTELTEKEDIAEVKNGEEGNRTKKIKKGKRDKESSDVEGKDNIVNAKDIGKVRDHYDGNIMEKVNHGKQEKKRKKKDKDDLGSELKQLVAGNPGDKSTLNGNKKFVGGTHSTEGPEFEGVPTTKENVETADLSEKSKPDETPKRVRFSGHVEVFPSSDGQEGLVQGKRFSPEEDEMVRKAVLSYIEDHGLGEEGINMILNCKAHRELKGCWKEIAAALPWRPHESVSSEGYMAQIKLPNAKKGQWHQEEYQTLFDLVNMDLRMKALGERKSKHGNWADADDYRLLNALFNLDACCMEDVDWDNLLDHSDIAQIYLKQEKPMMPKFQFANVECLIWNLLEGNCDLITWISKTM